MATAEVLSPLAAELRTDPSVTLTGAVAVGPADPFHYAHLHAAEPAPPAGSQLLSASAASLSTQQWIDGGSDHAQLNAVESQLPPLSEPPNYGVIRQPTLRLVAVRSPPEFSAQDYEGAGKHIGRLDVVGAECRIGLPGPEESSKFPDDPGRVSTAKGIARSANQQQLKASCGLAEFRALNASLMMVYGLDLLLESPDLQQPDLIQTGTFAEEKNGVQTGRRITRILIIAHAGEAVGFLIRFPAQATFYSGSFVGVGRLVVAPTDGSLRWGDTNREGRLESFEAEGEFSVSRSRATSVGLQGQTLGGPAVTTAPTRGILDLLTSAPAVAAAGAAAALVAVNGAWWLYSKLTRDRLLDHPRRAQIFRLIEEDPGLGTRALATKLEVHWSLVAYHVRTLAYGGHVKLHRYGGRTALFPTLRGFRGKEDQVALLRQATARRVFEAIQVAANLDQAALALRLGTTQSNVSKALRRLVASGLVRVERAGRRRVYAVATAAP